MQRSVLLIYLLALEDFASLSQDLEDNVYSLLNGTNMLS